MISFACAPLQEDIAHCLGCGGPRSVIQGQYRSLVYALYRSFVEERAFGSLGEILLLLFYTMKTRTWATAWFLLLGCCVIILFVALRLQLHDAHTTSSMVASRVFQQASYRNEGNRTDAMPLAEPHGNTTTFQLRGLQQQQQQEQERYPHKLHLAPPHVPHPKLVLKTKDNPTGTDQFCNSYKDEATCLNTKGRCDWFSTQYCAISCQSFIKESSCISLAITCRWVDGRGCIRQKRPR